MFNSTTTVDTTSDSFYYSISAHAGHSTVVGRDIVSYNSLLNSASGSTILTSGNNISAGLATQNIITLDSATLTSDYSNKGLYINSGTGAGQIFKIVSNTSTVITVTPVLSSDLSAADTTYQIFEPNRNMLFYSWSDNTD